MRHLSSAKTIAFLALFLLIVGGAYAAASSIPGPGGVISSCYQKNNGNLRVVKSGKKCKKSETALSWNQKGVTGATGAQGAQGAAGAQGTVGSPGTPGTPGGPGFVQLGSWAGSTSTLPASGIAVTFLGPTATLTTTATQSIAASGSSALATSTGTATIDLAMCIQPSTGGALQFLNPATAGAFQNLNVTTTRSSFAASAAGTPGAGTWNVGVCARNTSTQAVNANDWTIGYAFVSNNPPAAAASVSPAQSGHH